MWWTSEGKEEPRESGPWFAAEFLNDILIKNSSLPNTVCLPFFGTVCINNKEIHLEGIYIKYCSRVIAGDSRIPRWFRAGVGEQGHCGRREKEGFRNKFY